MFQVSKQEMDKCMIQLMYFLQNINKSLNLSKKMVQLNPDTGAELVKGNMAPICGLAPNLKVHFHGFLQKSPEFSNVLLEDAIVAPISRKNWLKS